MEDMIRQMVWSRPTTACAQAQVIFIWGTTLGQSFLLELPYWSFFENSRNSSTAHWAGGGGDHSPSYHSSVYAVAEEARSYDPQQDPKPRRTCCWRSPIIVFIYMCCGSHHLLVCVFNCSKLHLPNKPLFQKRILCPNHSNMKILKLQRHSQDLLENQLALLWLKKLAPILYSRWHTSASERQGPQVLWDMRYSTHSGTKIWQESWKVVLNLDATTIE